ncbi:MAG: PKD domain-containing protein [Methanothrix sp.]|uniref:PKD domain-containing protein n=1 Tax=Methanothrix sp. TaxID=90426 RepID=UPI0025F71B8B|nr:PKD domain-containing protein [Methanothrix sp.]MCQ8903753.1 PKD domain-containing protein [Methanothrix sp.]
MQCRSTVFLMLVVLLISPVAAEWPDCKFQCTSKDVVVESAYLGDASGRPLKPCSQGAISTAYIWVTITNRASSPRYNLVLLADLVVNGNVERIERCVLDVIEGRSTMSFPIYEIEWSCGEELHVKDMILSWDPSRSSVCDISKMKCGERTTQCYAHPGMSVDIPLSGGFEHRAVCQEVHLRDLTRGGAPPYIYNWDLGDGNRSSEANPVHAYSHPGRYLIIQNVTDSKGRTSKSSSLITIEGCICEIDGPEAACEESVQRYTANATGREYTWMIDGRKIGYGDSIDINWSEFGTGSHELRLIAGNISCVKEVIVIPKPEIFISFVEDRC